MATPTPESLPPEGQLAIAYTPAAQRGLLTVFLDLDIRLARIVAATSEPMLGQMRLAWWRETLAKPVGERPLGDAVLDGVAAHWQGREGALVTLVDGWERLLADPPLGEDDARACIAGRAGALAAIHANSPAAQSAAWCWAAADLAGKVTLEDERAMLVRLGLDKGKPADRLPGDARGLAVLGALGMRSLQRGGRPLMEGRGASLAALRAAFFGR